MADDKKITSGNDVKTKYAGTETEKNLQKAYAGESMARTKYLYFASTAQKEGFQQIGALFEETATNENAHAKMWLKELNGIGDTATNLLHAAEARATSGTTCMSSSPRRRRKRALRSSQRSSAWSRQSRSATRRDTESS